jgi:hypothetical protein
MGADAAKPRAAPQAWRGDTALGHDPPFVSAPCRPPEVVDTIPRAMILAQAEHGEWRGHVDEVRDLPTTFPGDGRDRSGPGRDHRRHLGGRWRQAQDVPGR